VTTYDEATVFIEESPELSLRYQREFNLLWANSQPVVGHEEIPYVQTMEITDEMIAAVDDPAVDAIFTSQNFRQTTRGLTALRDGYDVADRFIEKIEQAERSIWLFSERLRSVPVAEALLRKAAERPDVEIRVYMDNQEYVSSSTSAGLMRELMECYATATTTAQRINCESGMYYSYEVSRAFAEQPNHEVRMKYYSYNWHYSFPQMHHKTLLVDGRWLLTGSYNLSENAEFNTFENVMILDGQAFPELIAAFEGELERLWSLNTDQYTGLMSRVNGTGTTVPIQFEPIAMTWQQVDDYRAATRAVCGHTQLSQLRETQETARYCNRL
jgi:phosphatidylserine/phosphatidylglycerophosphate/cardiolipin synthase-like enzyme